MTKLLIRLFVKNPEAVEDPEVRTGYGTLAAATGIVLNLLLSAAKFLIGLLSHSVSIVADAANNLSDAAASLVTFVTTKLSNRKPDEDHPYGYGRMEYIGSLVVGALILVMGATILKDGITAILHPEDITASPVVIIVLVLSILGKLWLWRYYRHISLKVNNGTLMAASKDSLSDVLSTAATLIGVLLYMIFGIRADGWVGALVSLLVLKAGYEVCKDTLDLLLGGKPDPEKVEKIREMMLAHPEILGVHDLVLHDYGPGRCFASAHAEVSAEGNVMAIHEVIDDAEHEIGMALKIPICIHTDPIVTDDARLNRTREAMTGFIQQKDSRLTLHDFRMVPGERHTNVIFDCVTPAGYPDREKLLAEMKAFAKTIDETYCLVVQFDTDYT